MKAFIATCSVLLLFAVGGPALADKPEWAGEGGQPTEREKERHKEEMTSKHEDKKKNKKNKGKGKGNDKEEEKKSPLRCWSLKENPKSWPK